MTGTFEEGDTLDIPCRHCASLSIRLEIREGPRTLQCAKCKGCTTVRVVRQGAEEWKILNEAGEVRL